jgi:hypothetical protein
VALFFGGDWRIFEGSARGSPGCRIGAEPKGVRHNVDRSSLAAPFRGWEGISIDVVAHEPAVVGAGQRWMSGAGGRERD